MRPTRQGLAYAGAAPATVSGEPRPRGVTEALASGRPDEGDDPRARRPAVTADFTSSGGVPRWIVTETRRHRRRRPSLSRPLGLCPHDWGCRCLFSPNSSLPPRRASRRPTGTG
ncbi:hypothetical protein KL86PLE_90121 [uncultured Pleomorphomonas sp.]|uniref:Uncharacterized protein n=1 Tax=uncultured Pleomorphomonas sp. TaxID=442121 RepID=A0A212LMY8_9HYPH|nr:hypothetical protein KL86PLE_90121 [uncultured Pleomorphomonas sp.]